MINIKSQRQVDQDDGFCPENCHFCPGLGLSSPAIKFGKLDYLDSCKDWPKLDPKELAQVPADKRHWFFPAKFLKAGIQERLLAKIPSNSQLTLLIGDNDFTNESLIQISKTFPIQIWFVANRGFNIVSAIKKIPTELYENIYFCCPLYDSHSDTFLTSQELFRLFKKLAREFPSLPIRPPEGRDLYNSTLSAQDLQKNESVLFDSCGSTPVNISVIIPSYNNEDYVCRVVKNLARQETKGISFEVTVIDDGSSDQTSMALVKCAQEGLCPEKFRLLHFPRHQSRKMGDFQFRAGLARTLGVSYSKGKIFAFLDSDILVPPNYIQSIYKKHEHDNYDVVQIQRLYLNELVSRTLQSHDGVDSNKDIFHPEGGYWKAFFSDPRPWDELPHHWKYVCTYGLSVKAEKYFEVGGFRSVFNSYGFEDTDLGYRLVKSGARFFKSSLEAYHLWHEASKSEFGNSEWKRQRLLGRSANIFFRHTLDKDVFEELSSLLFERRSWKNKFRIGMRH